MSRELPERLKLIGKVAFIREEMTRLGFWPPSQEVADQAADAERQLRALYNELARLRGDLTAVEAEIAQTGDVPRLLAEIRKRRIERVRAEHAKAKAERQVSRETNRQRDSEWKKTTLPFLGHGVSGGLRYTEGDREKIAANGLPLLETASDVSRAIGIEERDLAFLTYHRIASTVDHYNRFSIPKRKGGTRAISSPKKRLRVAQDWLRHTILDPLPVHEAAMAFRPGVSIADNAARHVARPVLLRIDLKDFFPSVKWGRVKRFFQSLGYNEGVSTIFALLATDSPRVAVTLAEDGAEGTPLTRHVALGERCLPQGACTSPALTNLLCRRLDRRLTGAAQAFGFTYTRYADDLIFSHGDKNAPVGALLTLARTILAEGGWTVNEDKTLVSRPQHRQTVTGVVVNETPHVSRKDLRGFRAFLHQCDTQGLEEMTRRRGQDALAYASGYLSFLHMVSPAQAERITARHPWLLRHTAP